MRIVFVAVAVLLALTPAFADVYQTDFENYAPGALAGQFGWYVNIAGGAAIVVNTDNGPSLPGRQCVELNNGGGEIRLFNDLASDLVATDKYLTIQYDVKNSSYPSAPTTFRLRVYDKTGGVAAIGNMNYDGGGGPASQAWAWDSVNSANGWAPGGPAWNDIGWHQIIWTLDYSTMDFVSVTFDGTVYPQTGWKFANWPPIAQTADRVEIRLFADDANDQWMLDNIVITSTAVPEPGSMLALAVGLVGILPFVRRKR